MLHELQIEIDIINRIKIIHHLQHLCCRYSLKNFWLFQKKKLSLALMFYSDGLHNVPLRESYQYIHHSRWFQIKLYIYLFTDNISIFQLLINAMRVQLILFLDNISLDFIEIVDDNYRYRSLIWNGNPSIIIIL